MQTTFGRRILSLASFAASADTSAAKAAKKAHPDIGIGSASIMEVSVHGTLAASAKMYRR
jgi:hypothetical protein